MARITCERCGETLWDVDLHNYRNNCKGRRSSRPGASGPVPVRFRTNDDDHATTRRFTDR